MCSHPLHNTQSRESYRWKLVEGSIVPKISEWVRDGHNVLWVRAALLCHCGPYPLDTGSLTEPELGWQPGSPRSPVVTSHRSRVTGTCFYVGSGI